jgi:hypothetical protein
MVFVPVGPTKVVAGPKRSAFPGMAAEYSYPDRRVKGGVGGKQGQRQGIVMIEPQELVALGVGSAVIGSLLGGVMLLIGLSIAQQGLFFPGYGLVLGAAVVPALIGFAMARRLAARL